MKIYYDGRYKVKDELGNESTYEDLEEVMNYKEIVEKKYEER